MFPSVILTFLLEVRLVSGAVHQLGDLVSGRQVHPAYGIVRLCRTKRAILVSSKCCLFEFTWKASLHPRHSGWSAQGHPQQQDSSQSQSLTLDCTPGENVSSTRQLDQNNYFIDIDSGSKTLPNHWNLTRLQLSQTKDAKSQQNYFIIPFIVN